ncbi:MAG: PilZ domain-containing protein [Myxococcales bacterium]
MNGIDRRKYPRCSSGEMATVVCEGAYSGRCRVDNVSVGGALLVTDFSMPLGAKVRIHLELSGQEVLELKGWISRTARSRSGELSFGVSFELETRSMSPLRQYVEARLNAEILEEASAACGL